MPFLNKVVVITGAGSGIGENIALKFAKLNARLALISRNEEKLKKSADNCEKVSKTKVYRLKVDVTVDDEVKEAIDKIVMEFGRIDVVVNCAGISIKSLINIDDENFVEVFDQIYNTNMRSIALITHLTAKYLIETEGNVVNISSIMALIPLKYHNAYATTKAALTQFTKVVALELAPKGVRLNSILPGFCQTNMLLSVGFSKEESDKFFESVEKNTPLKRNVSVQEISELVALLTSDNAKSITGAAYTIDAGLQLAGSQVMGY